MRTLFHTVTAALQLPFFSNHLLNDELIFVSLAEEDKRIYFRDKKGESLLFAHEIQTRFGFCYRSHLLFHSPRAFRYAKNASEKSLRNEDDKRIHLWQANLLQKGNPLEQISYISFVNPFIGYGLFAREKIAPYTLIGEYTGKVRFRKRSDQYNNYIFSYNLGSNESAFVIDAEKIGNLTRFINHSDTPNLRSHWRIEQGICHIMFYSRRTILPQEQFSYDYGPLYWIGRSSPEEI